MIMKVITVIFLTACVFSLGFLANSMYSDWKIKNNYQRQLNGLWIPYQNETGANNIAESYDRYGRWICVNIRGMDFQQALNTCRHETYHEIFARCGENNSLSDCIKYYNGGTDALE